MIREILWQALAALYAATMALVPRRVRYRVAATVARPLARLLGPALLRRPMRFWYSTPLDETLRALLRGMVRARMRFDIDIRYDGTDETMNALHERGGVLISAHFPLNAAAIRLLHDRGLPMKVVRGNAEADPYVWGHETEVDYFLPSPTALLKVRRFVGEKRCVLMSIDRDLPFGRTVPVETAFGVQHVSTPVFEFARRTNVPLYFICGRSNGDGAVHVVIRPLEPSVEAFAAQMRQQTAALLASRPDTVE